jgi:hypothetical protein
MSRKLDFSKFNTSDDEGDDGLVLPKVRSRSGRSWMLGLTLVKLSTNST